jgi:hypothetical protein
MLTVIQRYCRYVVICVLSVKMTISWDSGVAAVCNNYFLFRNETILSLDICFLLLLTLHQVVLKNGIVLLRTTT